MNSKDRKTLLILQEECAEVIQAVSKVFRFGADMRFPEPTSPTNNQKLEEEIGDLMGMIGILIDKGIVDSTNVTEAMRNKKAKLKKWSTIFETKQD